MDRTTVAMFFGFGVLALTAQHAFSQERTNCAPRDAALQQLQKRWGETRRSVMLATGDRLFEVFAAERSGTWTILRTTPDGVSCVMASGTAYERTLKQAGAPT
jgi:hypothetical protein